MVKQKNGILKLRTIDGHLIKDESRSGSEGTAWGDMAKTVIVSLDQVQVF